MSTNTRSKPRSGAQRVLSLTQRIDRWGGRHLRPIWARVGGVWGLALAAVVWLGFGLAYWAGWV